ncbi:MAG TPA: SDR family NAD(P)-dependent oxidoreductase, partial [Bacillota bacterium]|nr:SDR family NAD(P)-dependent oxidoreductase [Bacillota bacterium]
QSEGKVICLSSVAAVLPIPFQSFYSATKAAINAAVTALRGELKPFGVTVCAIMPGDVKTGFTAARVKSKAGSLYSERTQRSVEGMENDEKNGEDARFVARRIVHIARKKFPAPLYTVGMRYKLFVFLTHILPRRLLSFLVNKLYA